MGSDTRSSGACKAVALRQNLASLRVQSCFRKLISDTTVAPAAQKDTVHKFQVGSSSFEHATDAGVLFSPVQRVRQVLRAEFEQHCCLFGIQLDATAYTTVIMRRRYQKSGLEVRGGTESLFRQVAKRHMQLHGLKIFAVEIQSGARCLYWNVIREAHSSKESLDSVFCNVMRVPESTNLLSSGFKT